MSVYLRFRDIAADKPFHAALVVQRGGHVEARREKTLPHCHDFWELMYVVEGTGTHWLETGSALAPDALGAGDLLLIRPQDVHAVQASPGRTLHFLNIAFLEHAWYDFCAAARLSPSLARWATSPGPLRVTVPVAQQDGCAAAFRQALRAFLERPAYLDLCGLWSVVVPQFAEPRSEVEVVPLWLGRACRLLQEEADLRAGLPRLVTLGGVSPAHLARTLKRHYGQTPTEFVNELKLKRAATLLVSTAKAIDDIAADCGFDNLSYFYRRFGRRFGCPPRAFRVAASKQVMPEASAS